MNEVDLRDNAVYYALYESAINDLGVYPKSVKGGEHAYEERTDYMNGWNDCQRGLLGKMTKLSMFLCELKPDQKKQIEDLLLDEKINLSIRDAQVEIHVNCNDLFYWACADSEVVEEGELLDLLVALSESPQFGELLWCCRKRKMRPQQPYYKYFSDEEKILFDQTGEPRDE